MMHVACLRRELSFKNTYIVETNTKHKQNDRNNENRKPRAPQRSAGTQPRSVLKGREGCEVINGHGWRGPKCMRLPSVISRVFKKSGTGVATGTVVKKWLTGGTNKLLIRCFGITSIFARLVALCFSDVWK